MLRRRKNYLINKPMQFAYMGIAIWLLLVGIILAGTVTYYITLDTILTQMEATRTFSGQMYEVVRAINSVLSVKIGVLLVFLVVLTGVLEILYMHRLAGPVYRIERTLREVIEGRGFSPIHLRQKDFFKSLADAVNVVMESEQKKNERVRELMQEIEKYPELRDRAQDISTMLH